MDISSVTSSSIFQTGLFANTGVQSVVFAIDTPATTGTSNVDNVDISGLGKLLSAASLFESGILQSTADSPNGFSTLATATQFFADAFNSYLQSGFGDSQTASGGSLGNLFVQLLDSRLNAASDNGASIISRLADIGISFQSSSTQSDTAQMIIDFQALQSAFNADQTGTITLLTQATQSIALLAAEFSGTLVQLENLTQTDTSQILPVTVASNGAQATTTDLATTTQPTTALALTEATSPATTAQPTATAPLSAAGSPATTEAGAAPTQTTTVSQATATQATAAETTTPATTTELPTTAVQPTATAPLSAAGSPTTAEAGTASTQTTTELPTTATQPAAAETTATTTEQPTTAAQPTATALLSAIESPATTVTASTQTTTGLPATTTPLALTTPAVAAELPATSVLPTATAAPTTLATASAVTVAPNAIPLNFVNPIIDASNPAVMAAIVAYHLVDGIFDTGQMHLNAPPPTLYSDSEIRPVAHILPVKLDLYV